MNLQLLLKWIAETTSLIVEVMLILHELHEMHLALLLNHVIALHLLSNHLLPHEFIMHCLLLLHQGCDGHVSLLVSHLLYVVVLNKLFHGLSLVLGLDYLLLLL